MFRAAPSRDQSTVVEETTEVSKALPLREKINENLKIPGSPPGLGNL